MGPRPLRSTRSMPRHSYPCCSRITSRRPGVRCLVSNSRRSTSTCGFCAQRQSLWRRSDGGACSTSPRQCQTSFCPRTEWCVISCRRSSPQAEHKIQSNKGTLSLEMDQVPKVLRPLVQEWTPEGYIVSFKVGCSPLAHAQPSSKRKNPCSSPNLALLFHATVTNLSSATTCTSANTK